MFEKPSRITDLAVRKQLLLAESALHRAQIAGRMVVLRDSITTVAAGLSPFCRLLVSATALLAAGRELLQPRAQRRSRRQQVLQVAALAASVWLALRDIRSKGGR